MIEALLDARLLTITPNVYPGAAPLHYQRPCAIYNRIGTEPTRDLDDDDPTAIITFQIDVYSTLQNEAITIARAIRDSMKAWDEGDIQCVAYTARQDMVDNTSEIQLFRVMQFFEIMAND